MTINKFLEFAGPSHVYGACVDCKCRLPLPVHSRSERKGKTDDLMRTAYTYICQECRVKREAENDRLAAASRRDMDRLAAASRRVMELKTMPYHDYLMTPEWQMRRIQMLEFAGHRCQVCNSNSRLNVHHRSYERRGLVAGVPFAEPLRWRPRLTGFQRTEPPLGSRVGMPLKSRPREGRVPLRCETIEDRAGDIALLEVQGLELG
jgi:hypothetical protein